MQVGADRIGPEALGQGLRRGPPREAAAAVADVEADAPPTGVVGLRQDPAVVAAGSPGRTP